MNIKAPAIARHFGRPCSAVGKELFGFGILDEDEYSYLAQYGDEPFSAEIWEDGGRNAAQSGSAMSRSDLVDVAVFKRHETEKAVLVHEGDPDKPVWLPKALIEIERVSSAKGTELFTVTLPERLAIKTGLV